MTRLPALGPRGEGWVILQFALLGAILVAGLVGPAWAGPGRLASIAAGIALLAAGTTLGALGLRDLRDNLTPFPRPGDGAKLVQHGVYALVRHPIYGGLVLGSIAWALLTASLVSLVLAAALGGFFTLKSEREEVWLKERFPAYAAYRSRTRRFIPWLL